MIKYFFIFLFCISCNNSVHKKNIEQKDIIIATYSLEGVSTQGAEVNVVYNFGKIFKSEIVIYGETGKATINYEFECERICVIEKHYQYKTSLENVNSNDDLELIKQQKYYLDYEGNIIGESIKDWIDVFSEFKDKVPFNR